VDDCTRAVYTKSLRLRSEAVETFKAFKDVAERELGMKLCEIMTTRANCQWGKCVSYASARVSS